MYKQSMEKIKFEQMPLIAPIQKALEKTGYVHPTPIQEQTIPLILSNNDLLGIAQTGTGKTAAFCLPIIQKLYETASRPKPYTPRVLILAPTRELALQIQENLKAYSSFSKLTSTVIFGGVGQGNQVKDLRAGVDILVATTGRLIDLIQQKYVNLEKIEILVLDEADRMLDMGFLPDINRILNLIPRKRQTLFFSATMPKEVHSLAAKILHQPKRVEVTPAAKTADKVQQSVIYVDKEKKFDLLLNLLKNNNLYKVMVFVEMKHQANKVAEKLISSRISAAAIHGNKSQGARQRALEDFKSDRIRVLVATDIAARGIDVDGITHVINFDLSHITENYVHRIGRTARAGAAGESITFCTGEEKSFIFAIEKETGAKIHVVTDNPFYSERAANAPVISVSKAKAALESKRISNRNNRGGKKNGKRGFRGGRTKRW
jgi:ATP-dependent RNA helicase RhlE